MKDTSNKYLTIEASEDTLTASLSINDCECCIDDIPSGWTVE